MGHVWPRHGHRGRPLNSVVSRHLSDLHDIANRKIAAERDKLIAVLPQQLEAAKRTEAAKGALHSGNTAALLRDLCVEPIRALGPHIIEQYKWAESTALFLTQTFATSLADAADSQIAPLSSGPGGIVGRVWPWHSGCARPLNSVVSRLIAMVLAFPS